MMSTLCYQRYPGGSGYNLTLSDVGRMSLPDMVWWYEKLGERWEAENKQRVHDLKIMGQLGRKRR